MRTTPTGKRALRFADEEHRQTYDGYLRQVQARVQTLLENYAIECALEMAVNKEASSSKLKQELEQYRSSHMSSAADHSGASHRDGYAQREAAFQKAVAANEPATSEQAYRRRRICLRPFLIAKRLSNMPRNVLHWQSGRGRKRFISRRFPGTAIVRQSWTGVPPSLRPSLIIWFPC